MFDYASGNDEDYQYSYQDEIDSAEFVDVENSQKDSRNRESMPTPERNAKSQAAEERESWDFIKAKMDQSLSKLGGSSTSAKRSERSERSSAKSSSKEEKEKKPKGPNPIVVFFGKVKSFSSAAFQKTAAVFKRKPKPEGEEKKATDPSRADGSKKPGVATKTFSFLKKKTGNLTDAVKATHKKNDAQNSSRESAVSKDSKPTAETLVRKRRRTYLIVGSLTMCIVLLFLTAGILFLVNRSGKPVAQNTETPEQTENTAEAAPNDELSLPITAVSSGSTPKEPEKETALPSLDSDLDLPGLIEEPSDNSISEPKTDKKTEKKKDKKEKKSGESEVPSLDELSSDLTVGDIVNSDAKDQENTTDPLDSLNSLVNESESKPADEKEEKSEDPLADLGTLPELDTSGDTSGNALEPGDLSDFPSLTDSTPETVPAETNDSSNSSLQEETPSLNETTSKDAGEKKPDTDSTPSLLDLPESDSHGSASISPTISRSEDQNQLPEEMGTPDGVTPGSNVDSWNTPENADVTDPAASLDPLGLNAPDTDPLAKKIAKDENSTAALDPPADPLAEISPTKDSKSDGFGLDVDLDEGLMKKEEKSSGTGGLGDLGQLDDLSGASPAQAPTLDSDLGSGNDLIGASKGQKNTKYTNYTSVKDDTFWKISEKFYQTPAYEKALSRYNIDVVPDPNNLKEGTVLQIPDVNFLRSCYPTLCPQPLQVVQVPASQNSNQTQGVQYYCAVEGDTLSLIAERLLGDASLWPKIYRLNADKIQEMDLVPAGVKLLIPADETIPEQNIWQ